LCGPAAVPAQYPERQVLVAGPLGLSWRRHPDAVGVQKQHNHHPGVVGLLAAGVLLAVELENGIEIQLVDQIPQKEHQMALEQPVDRRGRRQPGLLRQPGEEGLGLAHSP
jgi:hypothetical protein